MPSTYLWRRSLEDLHVNSIWQRLRQNLLLFLQLLLVALLALALLRPGWRSAQPLDNRLIFLVDNSASMNATDVLPSRLDEAKRRVGDLIDQMESGTVAMIVSFSSNARVEQPFTDNRRQLRRQLEAIRPTHATTRVNEALRVAAGLANPNRAFESEGQQIGEPLPATLYILSDGKFPDVEGFSLGNLKPVFVPIGEAACRNVGITAFSTKPVEGQVDRLQVFARLENAGPTEIATEVELYRDGMLQEAAAVTIKSGASAGVVFDLANLHEGLLKLRTGAGGDLADDDEAWVAINRPERTKTLLVTPGNDALALALRTAPAEELTEIEIAAPDILADPNYRQAATQGKYRLIIYDQCAPAEMPQSNTLFIGRLPPQGGWSLGRQGAAPQVIDVDNAHPLMQLIDLGNVRFADGSAVEGPPSRTVLIDSNLGPLFAVAPRDSFEDAVLGVEIVSTNAQGERWSNTDWPLRLSFPVFALNVIDYLAGGGREAGAVPIQAGQTVEIPSPGAGKPGTVVTPSGKPIAVAPGQPGPLHFSQTEELGAYEIALAGQAEKYFTVNLADAAETDIRPRPENALHIGYVEVTGQVSQQIGRQDLWRPLAWLGLAVLLFEWYIYNRRVYL